MVPVVAHENGESQRGVVVVGGVEVLRRNPYAAADSAAV